MVEVYFCCYHCTSCIIHHNSSEVTEQKKIQSRESSRPHWWKIL